MLERYYEYTFPAVLRHPASNAKVEGLLEIEPAVLTLPHKRVMFICSILHLCLHHPVAG